MKYILAQEILDRILNDNDFSLRMALHMKMRQSSLFKAVMRGSDILKLPEQVNFYMSEGYTYDQIFVEEKTK